MIINIPINIDDQAFEGKISEDIQARVVKMLAESVTQALKYKTNRYYNAKEEDGMLLLIEDAVDKKLEEYRDVIIEKTAEKLATKLATRKAAKDLIADKEN